MCVSEGGWGRVWQCKVTKPVSVLSGGGGGAFLFAVVALWCQTPHACLRRRSLDLLNR